MPLLFLGNGKSAAASEMSQSNTLDSVFRYYWVYGPLFGVGYSLLLKHVQQN
jgi:hypothetical protein